MIKMLPLKEELPKFLFIGLLPSLSWFVPPQAQVHIVAQIPDYEA